MLAQTTFTFGSIIVAIIDGIGDCIGFLQSITLSFGQFEFSLFDFLVACIVLWVTLSFIFPWFGEEDE